MLYSCRHAALVSSSANHPRRFFRAGHGGGGDDFAHAGQIEDGFRSYSGRRLLVGEAAACVAEFDLTASQNAEGAAGEGTSGDGRVEA